MLLLRRKCAKNWWSQWIIKKRPPSPDVLKSGARKGRDSCRLTEAPLSPLRQSATKKIVKDLKISLIGGGVSRREHRKEGKHRRVDFKKKESIIYSKT